MSFTLFTVSALYFCAVYSFSELLLFRLFLVYATGKLFLVYGIYFHYSQTSLIQTPKGQNQVSALQMCPYYTGREWIVFGISGAKPTVYNREVSVL